MLVTKRFGHCSDFFFGQCQAMFFLVPEMQESQSMRPEVRPLIYPASLTEDYTAIFYYRTALTNMALLYAPHLASFLFDVREYLLETVG